MGGRSITQFRQSLQEGPELPRTDRLAEEAEKFIRANQDVPFFLNFWDYSVHDPYQAKMELVDKYRKKAQPDNPQRNPVMAAMIEPLDDAVGRLLDTIDELGLADNTIFIFTSDNGGNMYDNVNGLPPTDNAPLRGGKATIYEGGVRVPLVVVWPGQVKAGSRSDEIVSSIDFYPTLLEFAGIDPRPDQVLDGESIVPVFRHEGSLNREAIFHYFPHYVAATGTVPATSVRSGAWKLIRFHADGLAQADRFELYNLSDDIGETRSLAVEMPEKVRQLNARIERHLQGTGSLVPVANPAYHHNGLPW